MQDIAPGDLVVIPFQVSGGECRNCRRGLTAACSSVGWLSCYGLGAVAGGYGGFVSDVVLVPYADAMLVRLPPALDPAAAASVSCNIVDAYRCVGPQLAADGVDLDAITTSVVDWQEAPAAFTAGGGKTVLLRSA